MSSLPPEASDDERDLRRGALAFMAGSVPRALAGVGFLVLAGNLYGLPTFGRFVIAIGAVELAGAICVLGMKRGLFPLMTGLDQGPQAARAIGGLIRDALGLAGLIALFLALPLAFYIFAVPETPLQGGAIILIALPLTIACDIVLAATRHRRKTRYQVLARSVIEPWSKVVLALIFYGVGWQATGLAWAYVGGLALAMIYSLIGYHRLFGLAGLMFGGFSSTQMRAIFATSLPIGVSEIADMAMRRLDVVLLGAISGPTGAGAYQAAKEVASLSQKTVQLFEPMLSPVIAAALARNDTTRASQHLSTVIRWALALQLLLLLLLGGYGPQILTLIGDGFAVAAPILLILLVAECFGTSLGLAFIPLQFAAPRWSPIISLAAVGIMTAGGAVLATLMGGEGMALGFGTALVLQGGFACLVAWRKTGVTSFEPKALGPLVLFLLSGLVVWATSHSPSAPFAPALGVAVYVAGLGTLPDGEGRSVLKVMIQRLSGRKPTAGD